MRKKDGVEAVKTLIIVFKTEYEKLMALRHNAYLRAIEEYK